MKRTVLFVQVAAALSLSLANLAMAKVPEAEASKLGGELTCVGAEKAGNKEGTIPEYTGKWLGAPAGVQYTAHVGQHPVDAYPNDKPLFTITAENMAQYAAKLTDGQKAMFTKYPKTYRIPVYPGRRDFRYPDKVCEMSKKNAREAELIDNGMGIKAVQGGHPFPIPKNGQEVLMNHTFPYRAWTEEIYRNTANVTSDGSISWGKNYSRGLNSTADPARIGKAMDEIQAYQMTFTLLPERDKGAVTMSYEPSNFGKAKRLAWSYDPGTRRVRQLPEFGFDQPLNGTGGKLTIDQDRLFNGSPERYNFKLIGKREIYIPANSYRIHSNQVKYADMLKPGHANPDLMRYELRRVWVVEATLKEGYRHVYGKRVLFVDEDNWHSVMSDYYDMRGQLWQHALINYYYAYDMQAWHAGTSFYHDLNSGGYIAYYLFQEAKTGPILNKGDFKPSQYTLDSLRAAGN